MKLNSVLFGIALCGVIGSLCAMVANGPTTFTLIGLALNLALAVHWAHQSSKD